MDTMIVSVKELSGQDRRMGRRKYSAAFKRKIAEEALQPGASVSQLSRRYDLNANMIFGWRDDHQRRQTEAAAGTAASAEPEFVAVGVVTEAGQALPMMLPATPKQGTKVATARPAPKPAPVSRAIELELRNGIKLRLDAGMATDTLRRVLRAVMTA